MGLGLKGLGLGGSDWRGWLYGWGRRGAKTGEVGVRADWG